MATLVAAPARLAGSAVLGLQSDDRLVSLARAGHERAFDAIVERYREPLIRYCGRVLPASRAEDAVQQTFVNAHGALLTADGPIDLRPWLYKIAHHAALNLLRQNGWNYEEIPLDFDGVRRPDQVVEQREELHMTVAALHGLPERQRDALLMSAFEGRSYEEIAARLGAGDGAVRQLLNRARAAMRAAVTALTPPPLLLRASEMGQGAGGGGTRFAEVVSGIGAVGLVKVGATVVVAGSLVVGAAKAPLPLGGHIGANHPAATGASIGSSAGAGTHAPNGAATPAKGGTTQLGSDGRTGAGRADSTAGGNVTTPRRAGVHQQDAAAPGVPTQGAPGATDTTPDHSTPGAVVENETSRDHAAAGTPGTHSGGDTSETTGATPHDNVESGPQTSDPPPAAGAPADDTSASTGSDTQSQPEPPADPDSKPKGSGKTKSPTD
jgi:RNA polymerase sigma factor (sigma-70 family)